MGQHEPVLFFQIDQKYLPSENDDMDIWVSEVWDEIEKGKNYYWVSSRNGVYHYGLCDICKELEIRNLAFIEEELSFLDGENLTNAQKAIHQVMAILSQEIPILTKTEDSYDTVWWLRETPVGKPYPPDAPQRAFAEAVVSHDLNDWDRDDCLYGYAICFFSFLKSLQQALDDAVAANQVFVFYKPLM